MNNLAAIAEELNGMTDELRASNDMAEYIESMREFRKSINPSRGQSKEVQPRPCNTGLIVGNFVAGYGARK